VTNVREEVDALMDEGTGATSVATVYEPAKPESDEPTATKATLFAPVNGNFMNLEDVPDDVFSKKMVGEGFAIRPADGNIYAGVSGRITSVFPTKHALGIKTDNGIELMLHLGLDTVELKGDRVAPETLVAKMDIHKIEMAGKDPVVLMVMVNSSQFLLGNFKAEVGSEVNHGTPILDVDRA
jgi:PTS system arbutin-like IIC component